MKPLVGVNYFSGWWRESPNKWEDPTCPSRDWREQYINRIPINGCYDDQETMDSDILSATKYGVNFFQMLWYPVDSSTSKCDNLHEHHLNNGIKHFCASPYNNRMSFVVEYCNHPPFSILDEKEWLAVCQIWAKFFCHPSYLTINGKTLFKIHGWKFFQEQCGHDRTVIKKRLDVLRETAKEYTGRDLIILGGITYDDIDPKLCDALDLVDLYSVYMDLPSLPSKDTDYDYGDLLNFSLLFAKKCADFQIPFLPYFPVGWNPRPWCDPRPNFSIPNKEQIADGVIQLCRLIADHPLLGIPCDNTYTDAFTMYAWNEFGEGGYLAPTLIEYNSKLEGLKQALKSIELF